MKILSLLGGVVGIALCAVPAFAFEVPATPGGYVNDYAHVLSPENITTLETTLRAFTATTSNEITVVTVPDMGNDYVEHYALSVAETWGVGGKENDNGILLLLAIEERAVRIEVGYGLEGALPDSVANRIIQNEMIPRLKTGDYDGAVESAVDALMLATQGEYRAETPSMRLNGDAVGNLLFFVFVFGSLAIQWLGAVLGRTKSWWLGGVIGAVVGAGVSSVLGWWILTGSLLTTGLVLFGLFFDYVVSSTTHHAQKYGVEPPWWAGGNSGGFGGSSGGGFGGFGGGSFGGGGASGRW